MKLMLVAGARPNFMKTAPICEVLKQKKDIDYYIAHIGQNYDNILSSDSILRSTFNPSFIK